MRIAVAGGTGTVGRHVVAVARERGHEAVVLSRAAGVDVSTGDGLDAALAGVDVVIDVTSVATTKASVAEHFFETATRRLLGAERRHGVAHHIALSIVGIDRRGEASGYYAGKIAQERAVATDEVPWTLLRATQFHEFARQMFERGRIGPVVVVPAMRSQPVAAREVAERLVALAEGSPAGRVRDLGGPRVERMSELSRRWG
ncbi:MAG: NAD(P)H-binding protein, partial [Microbacterium sp.]|nr:NAD(P)H-binding protein [Microbacterium sp.]